MHRIRYRLVNFRYMYIRNRDWGAFESLSRKQIQNESQFPARESKAKLLFPQNRNFSKSALKRYTWPSCAPTEPSNWRNLLSFTWNRYKRCNIRNQEHYQRNDEHKYQGKHGVELLLPEGGVWIVRNTLIELLDERPQIHSEDVILKMRYKDLVNRYNYIPPIIYVMILILHHSQSSLEINLAARVDWNQFSVKLNHVTIMECLRKRSECPSLCSVFTILCFHSIELRERPWEERILTLKLFAWSGSESERADRVTFTNINWLREETCAYLRNAEYRRKKIHWDQQTNTPPCHIEWFHRVLDGHPPIYAN